MKKQIIALICCFGIFTSCSKFLDREPFTSISTDVAIQDATSAYHALLGIYNRLQSESRYGRIIFVIADAATENVILAPTTSNRFLSIAQWTSNAGTGEHRDVWTACYVVINAANEILARIETMDATDAERQVIQGEALAIRGLMHFELIRLFSQAYSGNENDALGIPYKTTPDIYALPPREDLRTSYNLIIEDLTSACNLLTPANSADYAPYRIDHWGAKAILARVYMAQLDYAKAKPVLADLVNNSGYTILSNADYTEAWNKRYNAVNKKEFMFAIGNLSDNYANTASLGYIYLQNGYTDLRVPPQMFSLYSDGDVRKEAFFFDGIGPNVGWTLVHKFPNREGFNGLSDHPIMRFSDVYLMYAEACAYTGDEVTAIDYLDRIRLRADPAAELSTETGDMLRDKILLERRKELAYEGHYYHDLKRHRKTIYSAYNAAGQMFATITPPDTKLAFAIHQSEMDVNPNMVQNPGY